MKSKTAMKTFKLTNTFHNTFAAFRAPCNFGDCGTEALSRLDYMSHNGDASASATLKRVYRKLCSIKDCKCKGMIKSA